MIYGQDQRFFVAEAQKLGTPMRCFLCGAEYETLWTLSSGLYMTSCDHGACVGALEIAQEEQERGA